MMHQPDVDLELETGSAISLTTCGVYVYAEDESTRVWGFRYSWGDGLVYEWRFGDPDPERLLWHIANGHIVVAHGAAFERTIYAMIRRRWKPHWPELRIDQQRCTMAKAMAMSLPADLDTLGRVLQQKQQKDMAGSAAMKKMMKPRKVYEDGRMDWWDDPALLDQNMAYCGQDVRTEEETDTLIPNLSDHEYEVWKLDQRINDRGICIDMEAVVRAVDVVEIAKRKNDARMKMLTGGAVEK